MGRRVVIYVLTAGVALSLSVFDVSGQESGGDIAAGNGVLAALTSRAEVVAEGLVLSIGPSRQRPRFTATGRLSPNGPQLVRTEVDVFFRLTAVYKGRDLSGDTVAVIARVPEPSRNEMSRMIEPGQKYVLFLERANVDLPEVKVAPTLPESISRYEIVRVSRGIDIVTDGWLDISDGRTRLAPQSHGEDISRYLDQPSEQFLSEVGGYLAD